MLSPGYLTFMTQSVGMILASSFFRRLTPIDTNHLLMVSLYMSRDSQAKEEFLSGLQEFGKYVMDCWNTLDEAVIKSNAAGCSTASEQVQTILDRIKKT